MALIEWNQLSADLLTYGQLTGSLNISGSLVADGDLLPAVAELHDIGSAAKPWKDLYLTTGSLKFVDNGVVQATISAVEEGIQIGNIKITTSSIDIVNNAGDIISTVAEASSSAGDVTGTEVSPNIFAATGSFVSTTNNTQITGSLGVSGDITSTGITAGNIQTGITGDNEIDTVSGNLTIDSAGGTITMDDNVVITGNLTTQGDQTVISTTNLTVEDKFLVFASGSTSATDGGIVISKQSDGAGFGLGYDTATTRWGVDNDLAINATDIVPDAYLGTLTYSTAIPTGNPTYGGSAAGYGHMHVKSDTGDIYIFA